MNEQAIEKKRAEAKKLYDEVQELERIKFDNEEMPKRRKMVGKYFKFRNSFSNDRPKWWLFVHIIGVDESGDFRADQLQIDCDGRLELKLSHWEMYNHITRDHVEATEKEWDAEVAKARRMLSKLA
jgi:hypothetical protein